MKNILPPDAIYSDPIGWARGMVGTRGRFIFWIIFLSFYIIGLLSKNIPGGFSEYWSSLLFILGFQLMFLYALRKLYLRIEALEQSEE